MRARGAVDVAGTDEAQMGEPWRWEAFCLKSYWVSKCRRRGAKGGRATEQGIARRFAGLPERSAGRPGCLSVPARVPARRHYFCLLDMWLSASSRFSSLPKLFRGSSITA